MSKLEELIQQYCPDGVEYQSLSHICHSIKTGKLNANAMVEGGQYPFFTCSDKVFTIDKYSFDTEALLVAGNGYLGNVKYYKGKFDAYQRTYVLYDFTADVDIMYVYYAMQNSFRDYALKSQKDGSVPYITIGIFDSYRIPIPPLPVQEEIVRVLDAFTELHTELHTELQKRKQQYNYYRDNLLSFEGRADVEWKKLGDIATLTRGGNFQKKDFTDSGVPCIHYGQIYTHFGIHTTSTIKYISPEVARKSKIAKTNDIVMAITSENVEDVGKCVAWLGNEDIAVSGHTAIIQHKQNAKYLSYYFHTSHFFTQKKRLAHGTKVIEISPKALEDVLVPIPSFEEQQKIVDILDRFDKLTNDLSQGLPAEIEARRKQYEYYRDQLLTFKQKA